MTPNDILTNERKSNLYKATSDFNHKIRAMISEFEKEETNKMGLKVKLGISFFDFGQFRFLPSISLDQDKPE